MPAFRRICVFSAMTLVIAAAAVPGRARADELPAVYVVPDHPVYGYVERLVTKRVTPPGPMAIRPWTRTRIARALIDTRIDDPRLSRVDVDRLRYYRGEFADEIVALGADSVLADVEAAWSLMAARDRAHTGRGSVLRRMFSVHGDADRSARLNVEAGVGVTVDTATTWAREVRVGGWVRIGEHWSAQAYMVDDVRIGSGVVSPSRFGPEPGVAYVDADTGASLSIDDPRALVTYHNPMMTLAAGVYPLRIGHGMHTRLILSRKAPALPHVRLTLHPWRWLTFSYVHAALQSGVRDTSTVWWEHGGWQSEYESKYYVAHRLDYSGIDGLEVGIGESIVYGGRGVEGAYLVPVVPFRAAQHDVGDLDNLQMWGDVAVTWIPRTRIYGTLFIDELSFEALAGGDNTHNWWAYQAGLLAVDAWGLVPDMDIRVEYGRALPWVYRHRYPWNTYDTFAMNGNYAAVAYPLGLFSGHNSDILRADVAYRLSRDIELAGWAYQGRRGDTGTVDQQYTDEMSPFLFGNVVRDREFGLSAQWEMRRDLVVSGELAHHSRRTERDGVSTTRSWKRVGTAVSYRVW